jgi:hypothetical protein
MLLGVGAQLQSVLFGAAAARSSHEPVVATTIPGMSELPPAQLYLIVETFKNGDAAPVYGRFCEQGRLAPDGLKYISSWVTRDLSRCYQVMECADRRLLDEWMSRWSDLVDFEVIPVIESAEASNYFKKLR